VTPRAEVIDLADLLDLAAGVPTLPARWPTSTLPPTSTTGGTSETSAMPTSPSVEVIDLDH
jgi:hypothetical protein